MSASPSASPPESPQPAPRSPRSPSKMIPANPSRPSYTHFIAAAGEPEPPEVTTRKELSSWSDSDSSPDEESSIESGRSSPHPTTSGTVTAEVADSQVSSQPGGSTPQTSQPYNTDYWLQQIENGMSWLSVTEPKDVPLPKTSSNKRSSSPSSAAPQIKQMTMTSAITQNWKDSHYWSEQSSIPWLRKIHPIAKSPPPLKSPRPPVSNPMPKLPITAPTRKPSYDYPSISEARRSSGSLVALSLGPRKRSTFRIQGQPKATSPAFKAPPSTGANNGLNQPQPQLAAAPPPPPVSRR